MSFAPTSTTLSNRGMARMSIGQKAILCEMKPILSLDFYWCGGISIRVQEGASVTIDGACTVGFKLRTGGLFTSRRLT